MKKVEFTAPLPPTLNHMYRRNPNGYGLYKTAEAKNWEEEVVWLFRQHKMFEGDIRLVLRFYFKTRRDWDSGLKPLSDAMQGYLFENDRQVKSVSIDVFNDKENPRVEVEVSQMEVANA